MQLDRKSFENLLREKGLKVTTQRLAVLTVLSQKADSHLTAEEIYDLVKVENPEIGLATVYRTVQLLLELKIIDRIYLDDGYVRYELGNVFEDEDGHHHHHLICVKCGKVTSFQGDLLEEFEKRMEEQTGFQIQDHDVKLYGYCADCRKKADVK
ncbi:MAG: transcriptional repressor [Lachnospiraceae bacterium]|nr:transcriptional repressor [Lachnospiraceae bacterium]